MDGKNFCSINISLEQSLEKIRNELSTKIQNPKFFDVYGNPIKKGDEKDFSIKESLKERVLKIKDNVIDRINAVSFLSRKHIVILDGIYSLSKK